MRPPPAPQQNELPRLRGISPTSPPMASSTAEGGGGAQLWLEFGLDQAFEQALLAAPPDVVAGGPLAVVEQAEIDAGRAQPPGHGLAYLLIARVEGGIVAEEPRSEE